MKRANGEGSVYQLADGRWRASVTMANGKRKTATRRSQKAARAALKEMLRQQAGGIDLSSPWTVGEWMSYWMPTRSVAETTADRDRRRWALYGGPLEGLKLTELGVGEINRWLVGLREHGGQGGKGLSPASVRLVRALLRRAMGQAVKAGLLPTNPVTLTDAPSVPAPEPTYLTAQEAQKLLIEVGQDRLAPFVWLCLYAGLRRGEALGLEWGDVDLSAGFLNVRRSLYRIKVRPGETSLQTKAPKTLGSVRRVPLAPNLTELLQAHLDRQRAALEASGRPWGLSTPVVASSIGGWEDPDNASRFLRLAGRRCGLDVGSHLLRRTCATLLLERGVDIGVVSKILGHSSLALTLRHYAAVLDQGKQEAMATLGAALAGPVGEGAENANSAESGN